MEVAQAVVGIWGVDRVGIRLSPFGVANDSCEDQPLPLYTYLTQQVALLDLATSEWSRSGRSGSSECTLPSASELFRPYWPNY